MPIEVCLDTETMKRLGKEGRLLLRTYQTEFAKNPTSPATEPSRSNMIALRHSINQIYVEAAALDVAKALGFASEVDAPGDEAALAAEGPRVDAAVNKPPRPAIRRCACLGSSSSHSRCIESGPDRSR